MIKKISMVAIMMMPAIALAAPTYMNSPQAQAINNVAGNPFLSIVFKVRDIVNTIIPILLAAAVAYFFWGVIQYAFLAKDDASKKTARGIMVYGIIGLFVMVAVWGLVNMLKTFTGTSNAPTSVQAPGITP